MFTMINMLKNLHKEESGQDLIEYALIGLIVALGALAGMGLLASKINTDFSRAGNQLTSAPCCLLEACYAGRGGLNIPGAVCTQDPRKALGRACGYELIVSFVACFHFNSEERRGEKACR